MIEPLKALVAQLESLPEFRQREAVSLLRMFVQGRITIEPYPGDEPIEVFDDDGPKAEAKLPTEWREW